VANADDIAAIEEVFVAQWSLFGRGPGGSLHEDDGLTWTEAPVPQLPYNAVIRTRVDGDLVARVAAMNDRYRELRVPYLWLVHPRTTPSPGALEAALAAAGLSRVENATGMARDLGDVEPSVPMRPITVRRADDPDGLVAFEALVRRYWDLGEEGMAYVRAIDRAAVAADPPLGERWVAWRDGSPVGKAYLSLVGIPGTAAVFGVYVDPAARGLGIAGALMRRLMDRARELGRERMVLHSSEMALGMYLRLGFQARVSMPVYATSSLHGAQAM
jgi:GNAT superfamily N-acetyltransferase